MFPVFRCGDGDCDGPFPGTGVGYDGGAGEGRGVKGLMAVKVSSPSAAAIESVVERV